MSSSITPPPSSPPPEGSLVPPTLPQLPPAQPAAEVQPNSAQKALRAYQKAHLPPPQPLTEKKVQHLTKEQIREQGKEKCQKIFNNLETQHTADEMHQNDLNKLNMKALACNVITALAIPTMIGLGIGVGAITGGIAIVPIALISIGALAFGAKGSVDYRIKAEKTNEVWNLSQMGDRDRVMTKFAALKEGDLSDQLLTTWNEAFPQMTPDPTKVKNAFHSFLMREDIAKELDTLQLDGMQDNSGSYQNLEKLMTVFVNDMILKQLEKGQVNSDQNVSKLNSFAQNNLPNAISELKAKSFALLKLLNEKNTPPTATQIPESIQKNPRLKEYYTQFEKDFANSATLDEAKAKLSAEISRLDDSQEELQKIKKDLFINKEWQSSNWNKLEKKDQLEIAKKIEATLRPVVEARAAVAQTEKERLEEKRRVDASNLQDLSDDLARIEMNLTALVEKSQRLQGEITTTEASLAATQRALASLVDPANTPGPDGIDQTAYTAFLKTKRNLSMEQTSLVSHLEEITQHFSSAQTELAALENAKTTNRNKLDTLTESMAADSETEKQLAGSFEALKELNHVVQISTTRTKLEQMIPDAKANLENASKNFRLSNVPTLKAPPKFVSKPAFIKKYELERLPSDSQNSLWGSYQLIAPLYLDMKNLHDELVKQSKLKTPEALVESGKLRDQLTAKEHEIQEKQSIFNKDMQRDLARAMPPLSNGEQPPALSKDQQREDEAVQIAHKRVVDALTEEDASKKRVDELIPRAEAEPTNQTLQADLTAETNKLNRLRKATLEEKVFETNALKKFNQLFPHLGEDPKVRDHS